MYNQQFQNQQNMSGQIGTQNNQFMLHQQSKQGQQQNKIKNPQSNLAPQMKGPQVNDRDSLNLALAQEKHLTDGLNVFAKEASHRQLHNDVMRILNENHAMTRELFDLMFRKGWYTMEAEQPQKIGQTHQQFTQYTSQFPYPVNLNLQ